MILLWIVIGTFFAGVVSVWLAAALALRVVSRHVQNLLSLAAGALLATAFTHLLPEAIESGTSPHALFATLLGGIVFFFLMEKGELYHHGHDHGNHDPGRAHGHSHSHAHDHDDHEHSHHHAHAPQSEHAHAHGEPRGRGGWTILMGDSVHTFCDGVLIAAAFVADPLLGLAAVLSVLAHEVPHHIGDFIVLRQSGFSPVRALVWTSAVGGSTIVGGLVGYLAIGPDSPWLPYLLVVAASSFIYVALADLVPQLQRRLGPRQTVVQVLWLGMGIAAMMLITGALHGH